MKLSEDNMGSYEKVLEEAGLQYAGLPVLNRIKILAADDDIMLFSPALLLFQQDFFNCSETAMGYLISKSDERGRATMRGSVTTTSSERVISRPNGALYTVFSMNARNPKVS
jgi:hypothetical protein